MENRLMPTLCLCALTLAEIHVATPLKSHPLTEEDTGGKYRRCNCIFTKSGLTVQRSSGYSTSHFFLLIFHIMAPTTLRPNASSRVAGIWMRVHIYPFTCMSVRSSSKQCASLPRNLTSAHLAGSTARLLAKGRGGPNKGALTEKSY